MATLLLLAATAAGAIAAVAGFGIGTILTPAFSLAVDIRIAVAAASIPHLAGSVLRCWSLRTHIDRRLLVRFGGMSMVGAFAGAVLGSYVRSTILSLVFALLLGFVAMSHLFHFAHRLRLDAAGARTAGVLSGFFGGLVGNQGGLRSAALLGMDLPRERFVATATAIAIAVDAARLPVYVAMHHRALAANWALIAVATCGVVLGTTFGARALRRIPELPFRRLVALLLLALAIATVMKHTPVRDARFITTVHASPTLMGMGSGFGLFFVAAVVATFIVMFVVLAIRYRGQRLVACPETRRPAGATINAALAAGTWLTSRPRFVITTCSRWPARAGCDQACATQIALSPEETLVRNIVGKWYQQHRCVYCATLIREIGSSTVTPALLTPDGTLREWRDVAPEDLRQILVNSDAVCARCELAEDFRRRFPEKVIDRPAVPMRTHFAVTGPSEAVY